MQDYMVSIEVTSVGGKKTNLSAPRGADLLDVLRVGGITIAADCGGRGRCGKCKVRVDNVEKLACLTKVTPGMRVTVISQEDDFAIQVEYDSKSEEQAAVSGEIKRPCIAVDIGTTTVALQLVDADSGKVARTGSFLNGQRQYGADVVSRIQYARDGGLDTLSAIIRRDLSQSLYSLCEEAGIKPAQVEYICIAGNTTMMYLLLGLPCESLGLFPFTPAFDIKEQYTYVETFGEEGFPCPVYLLPWASAYVGGDITAGYLACCTGPQETAMLIDMGTNGEMMFWSGDKVWCTSTAAGPAFEGGGITFGTGSIPGAISLINITEDKTITYETIGGAPPVGICGSGVLDAGAGLFKAGYFDETGLMEDDYFDDGVVIAEGEDGRKILFTQKDIRELQLAKSAIRAGVEILLDEAGVTIDQLDSVYLAGGFGQKLRLESAVGIGLLPEEIASKARPIGNSSLGGCVKVCSNLSLLQEADALTKRAKEVLLSAHKDFQNLFMQYMAFDE